MADVFNDNDKWQSFRKEIESLRKLLRSEKAGSINKASIRDFSRTLSEKYHRLLRPELLTLGLDVANLDDSAKRLRELSEKRSPKSAYYSILKEICRSHGSISLQRDLKLGTSSQDVELMEPTTQELMVIQALEKIDVNLVQSYKQVSLDLSDEKRISYRGTASEIREVLRAALDYLAPDEKVKSSNGFQLEKDRKGPTMKQKVRYLLKARSASTASIETASTSIDTIEEKVGALVRAAYERGSSSTHGSTSRTEIKRLKSLVDVLLCELFDIEAG